MIADKMESRWICLALFIIQCHSATEAINYQKWMGDNEVLLSKTPLWELFIPATHDSGTYDLLQPSDRPADDRYAPDETSDRFLIDLASWTPIVHGWSQTQNRSIGGSLAEGIRSVDLRICLTKSSEFRICHGLYGPELTVVLADISAFAKANPTEVIIVGFNGFAQFDADGKPAGFSQASHDRLIAQLQATLADVIIDHQKLTPTSTLGEFWTAQKSSSRIGLVAIKYGDDRGSKVFWPPQSAYGSWVDTWDIDRKKSSLSEALKRRPTGKLFEFSGPITDDATMIALGLDPMAKLQFGYPSDLKQLAAESNPVMLDWIMSIWAGEKLNIVALDWYHQTCLVDLMLQRNGLAVNVSREDCHITSDTNWHRWHASHDCPDGYKNALIYCRKPDSYGRGVGSTSQGKCGKSAPSGCERWGLLWYPKCRQNFHSVGCCVCSANCPGMKDLGVLCQK